MGANVEEQMNSLKEWCGREDTRKRIFVVLFTISVSVTLNSWHRFGPSKESIFSHTCLAEGVTSSDVGSLPLLGKY